MQQDDEDMEPAMQEEKVGPLVVFDVLLEVDRIEVEPW